MVAHALKLVALLCLWSPLQGEAFRMKKRQGQQSVQSQSEPDSLLKSIVTLGGDIDVGDDVEPDVLVEVKSVSSGENVDDADAEEDVFDKVQSDSDFENTNSEDSDNPEAHSDDTDVGDDEEPDVLAEVQSETFEANADATNTSAPDIYDIYRIGHRAWDLVKDGRTVSNLDRKKISAKPRSIPWSKIGMWNNTWNSRKTPASLSFAVTDENNYEKIKFELSLKYSFGGRVNYQRSYQEMKGKGRFLRDIRLVPTAKCGSGFFLNAKVTDVKVKAMGPRSNPVADVKIYITVSGGKSGRRGQRWDQKYELNLKGTSTRGGVPRQLR